ncbi:MAG: DUF3565 domain-containing protein [Pseudomonadales bacterium]|nr:DUF3565 domain-containing protein [Pseudomonadales bacterium]
MQRAIVAYHKDEEDDWVAELDCCHNQHVRHQPPFFNRPWTQSQEGRDSMLGQQLNCVRCDALEWPENLQFLRKTDVFDQDSFPEGLKKDHATKPGTWGKIIILEGRMLFVCQAPVAQTIELDQHTPGIIPPELLHHVEPLEEVSFFIEFYSGRSGQFVAS